MRSRGRHSIASRGAWTIITGACIRQEALGFQRDQIRQWPRPPGALFLKGRASPVTPGEPGRSTSRARLASHEGSLCYGRRPSIGECLYSPRYLPRRPWDRTGASFASLTALSSRAAPPWPRRSVINSRTEP